MSEPTQFAQPHHLTTRETMLRPDSANSRSSGGGMTVAYGMDDGMIVDFYDDDPEYMEYLSKTTGAPIYRMRIMTRIVQPGNNKTIWTHPTKGIVYEMVVDPESGEYHTNWDIQEVCDNGDVPEPIKYAQAWARFMKKGVSADSGVPIEQWGAITKSYALSLKGQNVHTVEALANLTDQAAQSIMGAVKYRDMARAFLDDRQRTSIVAREQERASRYEELAAQQAKQIEALQQHVLTLQAKINGTDAPSAPPRQASPLGTEIANYGKQEGIRQMSVKDAKRKHRIPNTSEAA